MNHYILLFRDGSFWSRSRKVYIYIRERRRRVIYVASKASFSVTMRDARARAERLLIGPAS